MPRWNPSASLSRREQYLVGRMARTGKLFAFLRLHRHELFDDGFQAQLEGMYRCSGEGKEPVAPALLAMVVLLQAYTGASDAQAVELAVVDARWQMVLGVIGQDEPPFSQGSLPAFRQRLSTSCVNRVLDGGRRVAQTRARECERSISSECAAVPQARAAARSAGRARGRARRGRGEHG